MYWIFSHSRGLTPRSTCESDERVQDQSDALAVWVQEDTRQKGRGRHLCDECGLDDNADKNGATNIGKKGLGKDIQNPLSSLEGVYEPSLKLDDETVTQVRVRLRVDSETTPLTSEYAQDERSRVE